ncbi:MAG: serine/threonine-protein kinase [Aggregatilineales bacterium]
MPETTQFTGMENNNSDDASLKADSILHGRYKIVGVLGSGGMGTVYQARDLNFSDVRKLVAIKEMQTIATDAALRASMLKTFRREANILAMLSHPAIPKIFDFFDINDRAYLVMEFINGSDLEILLTKLKEVPIDKVVDWAIELCDALDYLHSQSPNPIVFRDLKPSNVMIDSLGKVRLIDFGIAKTFVTGVKHTMIGTEGYSAPEQYRGDVTPQSDIYSLGATLHHVLTRKDPRLEPPFNFHERPIPNFNSKAPPELVRIVEKALAYNASERFRSCAEMKEALEQVRLKMMNVVIGPVKTPADENGATDFFADEQNSSTIQPRWKFKTEDEIRSSPVSVRDIALVGSYDTNMWAVKLDNGELVWKFPTHGGIASSPVIDDSNKLVLFGSEDNSLYAVDYRSGRISWTYATKDRIRSTPRIAHEHVFFGSDDGKIYALGVVTGRFLWAFDMVAPVRSRPFVTNELVIVGCESGELIALGLSGTRKWSYRAKRGIIAGPLVDLNEGICYVGSTDGYMYALDAANGFNSWRFRTNGPIIGSAVASRGLLYFGSADGNLYCINAQTAREKWKFHTGKPIVSTPAIHRNNIYFGCIDQHFYCLEADTGKERWRFKTNGAITSAPHITEDLILIGSLDGILYAFPLVG